nr:MAG TPA: hypothetical protein [Caudoviricetes sp.]
MKRLDLVIYKVFSFFFKYAKFAHCIMKRHIAFIQNYIYTGGCLI